MRGCRSANIQILLGAHICRTELANHEFVARLCGNNTFRARTSGLLYSCCVCSLCLPANGQIVRGTAAQGQDSHLVALQLYSVPPKQVHLSAPEERATDRLQMQALNLSALLAGDQAALAPERPHQTVARGPAHDPHRVRPHLLERGQVRNHEQHLALAEGDQTQKPWNEGPTGHRHLRMANWDILLPEQGVCCVSVTLCLVTNP